MNEERYLTFALAKGRLADKTLELFEQIGIGCQEMKDKKSLLRVVRSPEGQVSLDFGGKKPGRGAYVCPCLACLRRARKSRALERAFETAIPPEVYDSMEAELRGADGQ